MTFHPNGCPFTSNDVGASKTNVGATSKFLSANALISIAANLPTLGLAATDPAICVYPEPAFDIVIASTSNCPFDVIPIVAAAFEPVRKKIQKLQLILEYLLYQLHQVV